jgi:hypothetical protein
MQRKHPIYVREALPVRFTSEFHEGGIISALTPEEIDGPGLEERAAKKKGREDDIWWPVSVLSWMTKRLRR